MDSTNNPRLKLNTEAVILFTLGIIALAASLPGSIKPWDEYQKCENIKIAGIKLDIPDLCIDRGFPPGLKPKDNGFQLTQSHDDSSLFKIISCGSALIILLIARSKLYYVCDVLVKKEKRQEVTENNEFEIWESKQEAEKNLEILQSQAIANLEEADFIDQLERSVLIDISPDDVQKQAEEMQAKLLEDQQQIQKVENYKALEFGDSTKPKLSEIAQKLYDYLIKNNHKEITVNKAVTNLKSKKNSYSSEQIREAMKELHQAELGVFDESSSIFKVNQ